MNYKTLFQVFLILLALFISGLFYLIYFDQEIKEDSSKQNLILDKTKSGLSEGNTIKEIFYESNDSNGNNYIIESDYGTFSDENKDEIIMVNVKAQINLKNGGNIYLMSDNAIYNSLNSDTKFFDNVDLEYLDHNVNADNIDVFFTDSKLEAYNNLIYRNSEVNLIADKVEVDLLTQDSKIFMFDNSKVKIIKD
tara:strand:- start:466 stop:1047 length:582 start_codon:yes stop_codon:yes gene_type:complete